MVFSSDLLSTYVYVIVSPVTYPFGRVDAVAARRSGKFRRNFVLAIPPEVG
jgi:hypothetical protein